MPDVVEVEIITGLIDWLVLVDSLVKGGLNCFRVRLG